jgi:RNA polymerase sigma-70 factor, ECF subfamily
MSVVERTQARSDGELARRIAAGDEAAFMAAYDAHAAVLFAVVTRLLSDREAAAEIVQETFVTLWQRAAQYRPETASLLTWLMRIARNRAFDRLRHEARRPRMVAVSEPSTAFDAPPQADLRVAVDDEPGPSLERRWTQAIVRTAVAGMPADEQQVLVLAYDHDLSQSQIAARLALPVGTVKSRTRRGMARLREVLGSVPDLVEHGVREASDGSR